MKKFTAGQSAEGVSNLRHVDKNQHTHFEKAIWKALARSHGLGLNFSFRDVAGSDVKDRTVPEHCGDTHRETHQGRFRIFSWYHHAAIHA
ncbi:hypothetical protein LEMLEM_LOCUS27685 [Lemmus lemmus]